MDEQEELKRLLFSSGADLVGFANASSYFKEYTTAIVMAISTKRIFEETKGDLLETLRGKMDFLGGVTRQWLSKKCHAYWGPLFSQEWKSPGVSLPQRELAIDAGLGIRGKNSLVVCERFGPRIHITSVLATMPFFEKRVNMDFFPCKECDICQEVCPTHAIGDFFKRDECILCFKCVLFCPAGHDAGDSGKFSEVRENIWGI